MHYLKIQNEKGKYEDAQKQRWDLLMGTFIWQPGKKANEGCDEFESLEAALEAYGLTEYKKPAPVAAVAPVEEAAPVAEEAKTPAEVPAPEVDVEE